jgi:hypothetical protein
MFEGVADLNRQITTWVVVHGALLILALLVRQLNVFTALGSEDVAVRSTGLLVVKRRHTLADSHGTNRNCGDGRVTTASCCVDVTLTIAPVSLST